MKPEAMKLTMRVMTNSDSPAAMSAEIANGEPSPYRSAMREETEDVPDSRMRGCTANVTEMTMNTAMVSPSARPRPSMVPPMMPPVPNGMTTVRTIPHRVDPRA